MVSSFFSTFCSISILFGAFLSSGYMAIAMEEVDSMALLPFGGTLYSGNFIRLPQCSGSHGTIANAQSIGVCYSSLGDNLPNVREVVQLYKSYDIGKMRIYNPNEAMLNALRGSNIEILLDIPNSDLQSITNRSSATEWVRKYIRAYVPDVEFRYIAVGNEVQPTDPLAQYVLPAIQSIYSAIAAANLQDQIKISTVITTTVLGNSFPPSAGSFSTSASAFIKPIVSFLAKNGSPLLANVYPYFSYSSNPHNIRLDYALFTASEIIVSDGTLGYQNIFDSIIDALYSALEKSGGGNVPIVVSESGWPSKGSTAATVENAGTYYRNLIRHVKAGTPKWPGRGIETYLFAMFDENLNGEYFGLFTPDKHPKYQLSFS